METDLDRLDSMHSLEFPSVHTMERVESKFDSKNYHLEFTNPDSYASCVYCGKWAVPCWMAECSFKGVLFTANVCCIPLAGV